MQRRDFLNLIPAKFSENDGTSADPVRLLSVSRSAMAGEFEISFDGSRYPQGTAAALDALDEIQRIERLLSVFLPDSRVQYINKVAAFEAVPLDEELFRLIEFALELSRETAGAVDITSTPLWKLWGFARHDPRVPTESEIAAALQTVGGRFVELDAANRTIRFTRPGLELSFGCIGKGFALDAAARILERDGLNDYLLHGGLSSILARGNFRGETDPAKRSGWTVGVDHPMFPGTRLAEITLFDEALGTSGSQKQFFRHQGRRFSHIIDPRSGCPAEKTLLVSLLAPNAAVADALSTAFFVMSPEEVERYCGDHPGIAALLVLASDRAPGFEIRSFGFTEKNLRFLSDV